MRLATLLRETPVTAVRGEAAAVEVQAVTADSRRVRPGTLFVAVRGTTGDGHQYIPAAIQAGAAAVCGEEPLADLGVPYVQVADSRLAVAHLAEAIHGHPSRALRLVGVTGTNGKTSTATLVQRVCTAAGLSAGLVGTVVYDVGAGETVAGNTTPGPEELSELLARARDHGLSVVSLEVSSHALAQERVAGLEFDVAVFTNCTQDHLDYHGDMESYFAAKRRLFEMLGRERRKAGAPRAVINADDPYGQRLVEACAAPVWTYGLDGAADLRATDVGLSPTGTHAHVRTPVGDATLELQLLGRHNVANALAALGAALALEVPLADAVRAVNAAPCVPGRCEVVDAGQPFTILVDYAHTPDGLRALLETCRAVGPHRIVLVFGCGGDRDRGKRPQMGELAGRLADYAFITSDNPRTEEPERILLDIEVGIQHAGRRKGEDYELLVDRREAIAAALRMAEPGDMVVIAGKGHEPYQIVGTERRDFDDRAVARALLEGLHTGGRC